MLGLAGAPNSCWGLLPESRQLRASLGLRTCGPRKHAQQHARGQALGRAGGRNRARDRLPPSKPTHVLPRADTHARTRTRTGRGKTRQMRPGFGTRAAPRAPAAGGGRGRGREIGWIQGPQGPAHPCPVSSISRAGLTRGRLDAAASHTARCGGIAHGPSPPTLTRARTHPIAARS